MSHIVGARRYHYTVGSKPPIQLVEYYVMLLCPKCGAEKNMPLFKLYQEKDTADERARRIAGLPPIQCVWCEAEIPFDDNAKRWFLALYDE